MGASKKCYQKKYFVCDHNTKNRLIFSKLCVRVCFLMSPLPGCKIGWFFVIETDNSFILGGQISLHIIGLFRMLLYDFFKSYVPL